MICGWPSPVRFAGDRLVLREWTDDDLPTMLELFDEPAVARFTPLASPFDLGAATEYLARARRNRAGGQAVQLAITTDGGCALGEALMFRTDRPPGALELGYAVGRAYRGRKLGTRAIRLLTAYGRALGFTTLVLRIENDNLASEAVARGAGYRPGNAAPHTELSKGRSIMLHTWEHFTH